MELFLGGAERAQDWLPLAVGAQHLLIRQNFYDWEHERPADLLIERVGGPVARPPERSDELARRIDQLRSWLEKGGPLWEKLSRAMLSLDPNTLVVFAPGADSAPAGVRGQIHCQENFRCKRDEAVIVSLSPPACRHWNLSLANLHWQSIDFVGHQSSLNGHQAELDAAGTFRAVIAHDDPGVANWLDPAGHEEGTLFGRFLLTQGALEQPRLQHVKIDALRDALPADTPWVSPEERELALRRRREALWRRYRL